MASTATLTKPTFRRSAPRTLRGPARLGRRTKVLARGLARGDIAILEHPGLDRVSADELVAAGVRAVVNCAPSLSSSYPNAGPLILAEAGVRLIDVQGDALFERCADGDPLEIGPGGEVRRGGELLAEGHVLSAAELRAQTHRRGEQMGRALERFALNTIEHMHDERELFFAPLDLPRLETDFRDRPALVVSRGGGYLEDLRALEPYIRNERPIIVAVDGAVDGVLEAGIAPDMIVGDMDSASDRALACGAELVAHAYLDGRAPGRERLERLGLPHSVVPAPGTSEDMAMLIAAEKGASTVVAVGSQLGLVQFLGRDRRGAASTFLTRLRLGDVLVDATGVSRLHVGTPARALGYVTLGVALGIAATVIWSALSL
jgi:uncharacterized membrane-anchored protein